MDNRVRIHQDEPPFFSFSVGFHANPVDDNLVVLHFYRNKILPEAVECTVVHPVDGIMIIMMLKVAVGFKIEELFFVSTPQNGQIAVYQKSFTAGTSPSSNTTTKQPTVS
eukprot:935312-Ditylum_brightwellii.AAC.1